jgi:hypothetical protein
MLPANLSFLLPPNQRSMLPLSFPVDVVGIKQQATVIEDVSDIEAFKYKVRFDDGFEDVFTIIEGGQVYIQSSQPGYDYYSDALVHDLYQLQGIEPGVFFYVLPISLKGEPVNAWLKEEEPFPGDKKSIIVSYYQRLGFELYVPTDEDRWHYRELTRRLTGEEKEIARALVSAMNTMQSVLQPSSLQLPEYP